MTELNRSSLHGSVGEPSLEAVRFLNEVMSRHPEAISFAPGAPHPKAVGDIDTERYVRGYLEHIAGGDRPALERARRSLYEYGPSIGLINDLIADALRRDCGIDVPGTALVVTVGAQEGMLLALRVLFRSPGGPARDLLAVPNPSYVGITGAARLLDIDMVPIPEADGGIDVDLLAAACAEARRAGRRIRACYVAPDFSNPGGTRMTPAARHRLLDLAERADLLLLEDSAYGFTAGPDDGLPTLKSLDRTGRVVHIGTFAKICFPGARVGYLVADQPVRAQDGTVRPLADEIAVVKGMVTVNTSPLCQAVIGGMLLAHGGSLAELSRRGAQTYRRNLAHLVGALDRHLPPGAVPGVHWNRPDGGFFVTMTLPVPADAALLEVSASAYGVLWTPMAPFYLDSTGDRMLRLSCSYLDPDRIDTGVARLADFLKNETGPRGGVRS
ncbi:PLP-dependent aminotransferase family protein [Streptomyces sp. ME19-01-6]|uniref:aminotransferase-like domain-containing protein n=1 Tax=Streptomyces sp. ME19-01-6 TaxID=3028686 RepID=UPI0029B0C971|nr:PLP-dependent aminotransferase family protein [Streptomyces sp. ME19-01-6]MDX3228666.1 PLP-dependent aminotransferase family protein [Streptomyces sp. ME19-01-6]